MYLVIVESPHKAKTIQKYLTNEYKVDASKGHIRDLPSNSMGINLAKNYEPFYVINEDKKQDIKRLSEKAKKADKVFLATDPDREGEAISWHLAEVLKLNQNDLNRIEFNEISKKAVQHALQNPRKINKQLVDAQQARRVLDRLVGYSISPVASLRLDDSLSAGRVQSVALRLVVDREREIQAFKPEEYWNIKAFLQNFENKKLSVLLEKKNNKKYKPKTEEEAKIVEAFLQSGEYRVSSVKKSVVKQHAQAPFITSTLQQDASQKLGLTSPQLMKIAQALYEGIDTDNGPIALITYMRTDSVRVSQEAQKEALNYIEAKYGKEYLPQKPNFYKSKNSAQDAHEAIRPIDISVTPESVKKYLDANQYKVYKLIYNRFIASQMCEAVYNTMQVEVACGEYQFKTSGKALQFNGYTVVYQEYKKEEDDEENGLLPDLKEGELLNLEKLTKEQKFTKPPVRYTEATLIKTMEDKGIGRPSTYATIMGKLSDKKREYIRRENKHLVPNEISYKLIDFLVKHFPEIMDIGFTARMETQLDEIGEVGKDWHKLIADFYPPFSNQIKKSQITDVICDKCGRKMFINSGKYGSYYSCTGYPECSNIKPVHEKVIIPTEKICDKCGSPMLERQGPYGKFLACSNYPRCKNTVSLSEPEGICPECGKPTTKMVSKKGKTFYGCKGYPTCKFMSWEKPTGKKCPKCGAYMIEVNNVERCSNDKCHNNNND